MDKPTDDIDALDRQLSRFATGLATSPSLEQVERRARELHRQSCFQVGFGFACLVLLLVVGFTYGWREASFIAFCALTEFTVGLTNLLCVREYRWDRLAGSDFLQAVKSNKLFEWISHGSILLVTTVMVPVYASKAFSDERRPLDLILALFMVFVFTYHLWLIRKLRRRTAKRDRGSAPR